MFLKRRISPELIQVSIALHYSISSGWNARRLQDYPEHEIPRVHVYMHLDAVAISDHELRGEEGALILVSLPAFLPSMICSFFTPLIPPKKEREARVPGALL